MAIRTGKVGAEDWVAPMDVEAAARHSFATGKPYAFIRVGRDGGHRIEVTVYPDGRVRSRDLGA